MSAYATDTAEQIADICIENWEKYGVLPSIAIAQAFVESGLGTGGSNLFGVNGCRGLGVYEATIRYLQCINNGYYPYAPFQTDPEIQINYILSKGRYCEGEYPGGNYYHNVIDSIYWYHWDEYDNRMFELQNEKARKEARRAARASRESLQYLVRGYEIRETDTLAPGEAAADPEYIKKGSTIIYPGGIVEVTKTIHALGNTILIGKRPLLGLSKHEDLHSLSNDNRWGYLPILCKVEIIEDAKG